MDVEIASSEKKREKAVKELFEYLKKRKNYLLDKPVVEDMDLYYYIKDFFKKYLSFDKELSFGEIMDELDKNFIPKEQKEEINNFISKIRNIEYENIEVDEKNIKEKILEFYDLAKNLPKSQNKKKNFLEKLLDKLKFKKRETKSEQEIAPKQKEETQQTQTENIPQYTQETQQTQTEKKKKVHEVLKNISLKDDFTEDVDLTPKQQNKEWVEDASTEQNIKQQETKSEDVYQLIMKAKKIKDEKELIEIYKKVNATYEEQTMEEKSKLYPELLEIYDKIIQAKKNK